MVKQFIIGVILLGLIVSASDASAQELLEDRYKSPFCDWKLVWKPFFSWHDVFRVESLGVTYGELLEMLNTLDIPYAGDVIETEWYDPDLIRLSIELPDKEIYLTFVIGDGWLLIVFVEMITDLSPSGVSRESLDGQEQVGPFMEEFLKDIRRRSNERRS